ncbi:bifunctional 3-(3-hydroxy-phenyl)propionate/3-hydroxycinnamic acid hydroxylase [Pusillimonas sp.]|uniref:bifunctional 3-(3-hydroxy-phenyl)propionate/3-hydroxycinnamic acid hydroxylase n=1 Tax=Pusillimonas sp. TaxID=3040095 RepID=UPI0037C70F9E
MKRYDVLIAGLGPTGITLAALLAQRGLRVAAFDKLPGLYPLPRAIGLDHEAMRLLQQLGLAEAIAPHVAPYRPSEYRGMDGDLIRRLDAAPAPYPLGWAPNYVFNQPALEHALRDHVANESDALIQTNCEITDFGQDDQGVWVQASAVGGGQKQRFEASYLIACDGGSSPIRKRLGIAFEDLGFDEAWLVVDSIVPDDKLADLPQTQVQYCDPVRPATFVVGPGNHRRWEIMLQPGDSTVTPFPEDEIWKLLDRWVKPGEITLWRSAAYRFHGLVATQWRDRRILLAGDAAHMTPPFMAQGMMQGLRDALNLSWKLARVLCNEADDTLLDSYEQERRPHTVATTRAAIELGRIICERDPAKAAERDTSLREKYKGETTIRQNMIPNLDAGLLDTTPGHGQLFPQPHLAAPVPGVLLDDLTGPAFLLVALHQPAAAEQAELLTALRPLRGVLVHLGSSQAGSGNNAKAPSKVSSDCQANTALSETELKQEESTDGIVLGIVEAGAVIEPWMRSLGVGYAVVRPDHYVYGTALNVDDALALLHHLAGQLRRFKPAH